MARGDKTPRIDRTPITTMRGKRLLAWLFSFLAGGAALAFVFFPFLMAASDPDQTLTAGLVELYGGSLFVLILPGLYVAVVYLGPVWVILRLWLGRQGETDTGAKPAVLPVWIAIWFLFAAAQILIIGEGELRPPPAPFSMVPAPFSQLFNGLLLVKMAGVTVMFAVYRRIRPM